MDKNYTLSFLLLDSMCLSNLPICISLYYTLQNNNNNKSKYRYII